MRKINEVIIHCSATPEGKDFTVADIDRWHRQRGFRKIGYHYVVYRDGTYHAGRGLEEIGAHCTGHNSASIGICYIGGVAKDGKTPKDTRTDAQKRTLITLIRAMKAKYPGIKVFGHRNFSSKACPSFDAKEEYKSI